MKKENKEYLIIHSDRSLPSVRHCRRNSLLLSVRSAVSSFKTVYVYIDRDDTTDSIYNKIRQTGHVNQFTGFLWMAKYKN